MRFLAALALVPALGVAQPRAVRPGIEVLLADSAHLVRGRRVGLITNHSGRARDGTSSIDLLFRAPGVRLTALFAPEHGIRGAAPAGQTIATTVDSATGVTVHSLYGRDRVPTPEMLQDVDVVLYDIQDVGARMYTYQWTMALSAAAVGAAGKRFIVLDRPNPIRADRVAGNILDPKFASFVGQYPVTTAYGMTPGELISFLVGEKLITADVTVVPMQGYRRDMWFDATGLPWVNPSPNIRTLDAAVLYPGTCLFEGTNLSEGRGTDAPFQLIGAPWLTDVRDLVTELNGLRLPGVVFEATERVIEPGAKHASVNGRPVPMVFVRVTDRNAVNPVHVGIRMLRAIYARHSADFQWRASIDRLAGTDAIRSAVQNGTVDDLLAQWDAEARQFAERTRKYALYP